MSYREDRSLFVLPGLLSLKLPPFSRSDDNDGLRWKRLEKNDKATVHEIEKIDRFDGHSAPMLRFRSTLKGPLVGEFFGKLLLDLQERKKWDAQIEKVCELYPLDDQNLDAANIALGGLGKYGDCARFGIGYGQTKRSMGLTPREQLFLYGLQHFMDGSCLIWGTELDEQNNHLLPDGKRHTRAKSHLFSAALTPKPNEHDAFDVEYILQLDIGGNIPTFLSLPKVIETVKSLFQTAKKEFEEGANGLLETFLKERLEKDQLADKISLLMTP